MHPIARALAIAYVVLAVVGVTVYVAATVNYVAVTDVQQRLDRYVRVSRVDLNWTGNTADAARIEVSIEVTNPGSVAIRFLNAVFAVHMENPNATDARPWYDEAKLAATFVSPGGFNVGPQDAIAIRPGETHVFLSVITVEAGTSRMNVLDHPDAAGRFHPIVWEPAMAYTFADFPVQDEVYLAPYHDAVGVLPSGR